MPGGDDAGIQDVLHGGHSLLHIPAVIGPVNQHRQGRRLSQGDSALRGETRSALLPSGGFGEIGRKRSRAAIARARAAGSAAVCVNSRNLLKLRMSKTDGLRRPLLAFLYAILASHFKS